MCYNCDKKVHRFTNKRWKPIVDYLFVRNHNTNLKELVKVRRKFCYLILINRAWKTLTPLRLMPANANGNQ